MSEIDQVHPNLYIASIRGARTTAMDEFDVVVTVCQDSIEDHIPEGVDYYHFNMCDGEVDLYGGRCDYKFFTEAASTVLSHLERGDTVLCHCHMGASRSVSTSIAALAVYNSVGWHEMYGQVKDSRPQIHPDELLISHAKRFIEEETGVSETERFK